MSSIDELFHAIETHDAKTVAALLRRGADPNASQREPPSYTALQAAINELEDGGSLDTVRLLLQHGADVNGWDPERDATALLMAVFRGQRDAVRLLLDAGADPNVVGGEGDTPLRWAVEQNDLETASILLERGATKMIDDWGGLSGYTPLGSAAENLNIPMIKLLLQAGADPTVRDEDGKLPRERLPDPRTVDARNHAIADALLKEHMQRSSV